MYLVLSLFVTCIFLGGSHGLSDDKPTSAGTIQYELSDNGLVSLAVYDEAGTLRRTLLSAAPRRAGKHSEPWDGLDRYGVPLTGRCNWKLLAHPGLRAEFLLQVGANTEPKWMPPVGNWHPAETVAADASGVYLGSGEAEGGQLAVKTTLDGRTLWLGGTGGQDQAKHPSVYALGVTKDRLYQLTKDRMVMFKGADNAFLPRPAFSVRWDGDKEGGEYQKQTDLDAADLDAVGEVVAVSYGERDAVRLYRRGEPGKEPDYVLRDTITDIKKPKGVAVKRDGTIYVVSEGKLLAVTPDKKMTTFIGADQLDEPHRVSVDQDSGDVFVSCPGKTMQVMKFSKDGKLLRTFGKKGGRTDGVFDPEGLRGILDIAADTKGGVIAVEGWTEGPRRVVRFDKDGKLVHQWFGGQPFGTTACPEPNDPNFVWFGSGYHLTRCRVDYDKRTWEPVETHPGFRTLGHVFRTVQKGQLLYLMDCMGWPGIKVYDPKAKTLRWAVEFGEVEKLPKSLLPEGGTAARLYLWCDLNDDGEKTKDELQFVSGWTGVGYPVVDGDLNLLLPLGGIVRLQPTRFTKGGTPVYEWAKHAPLPKSTAFAVEGGVYTDPAYYCRGPGGKGWYRVMTDFRRNPGHWDKFGPYFHSGYHGINRVIRYDDDFKQLWEVGRHSADLDHRPGEQSRTNPPAEANGCVIVPNVSDTEVPWYDVYDQDGLYVDQVPSRQADDLPEFAYAHGLCGDNYGCNVWTDPKTGDVLLFVNGIYSGPIYRITGWKNITRQSGTVTLERSPTAPKGEGKGLPGDFFDGADLKGEPALKRTGEAYVSMDQGELEPKSLKSGRFSVRWTGQVEAPLAEPWEFVVYGSDDINLWVGGHLVADTKANGGTMARSAPIRLAAGRRVDVVVEVRNAENKRGEGKVMLGWESPSTERQSIPARFLYEPGDGGKLDKAVVHPAPVARTTDPQGLFGHWKFDDGKGITAMNEIDPFQPGQLHLARWTKAGRLGGGVEFDGGSYVSVQSRMPLDAQTVSVWFRTTSEATTLYEAGRYFTYYNNFVDRRLTLDKDGVVVEAGKQSVRAKGRFNDGKWHHVAHVFGTAADGQRLYLDGVEVGKGAMPAFTMGQPLTVRLGPAEGSGAGMLDDVRFYDRALPAESIKSLFVGRNNR